MRPFSLRLALAASALLAANSPAQISLQKIDALEFTVTLGEQKIASESVKLRADGWSASGEYDILGTRSGSYTFDLTRTATGYRTVMAAKAGSTSYEVQTDYDKPKLTVKRLDKKGGKTIEIKGDGKDAVFAYEDLLWASMLEAGHTLAALDARNALRDGMPMSALIGSGCHELPAVHVSTRRTTQAIAGKNVFLRISTIRLGPTVEMIAACTREGIPLRIEVPSQKIIATAKGFEDVRSIKPKPTSIVDAGPWRQKLSKPNREFTTEEKVMVPMRDGVKLAADVFLPVGDGPFPTILARTPYNRTSESSLKGAYYARRGYAFVAQDVRGRNDSEGEWFPFNHETADGSDTLDWIAAQPWSDKQVGMIGASYVGLVQWLAAKSKNKHLKCIVPQVSPPDPHENFPYEGGAFMMGVAWWARVLEAMDKGEEWNQGMDWWKVYKTLPLNDLDKSLGLDKESFIKTWLAHPPHDTAFWAPSSYQDQFGEIDLPALHISGWYDGDQPGALQNFIGMRKKARQHGKDQYLVMGPWTHFFNSARRIGSVDFGDEAMIDLDARIVRFFDHYLKGIANGIADDHKVFAFIMGANRWQGADIWPLPGTTFHKLHLESDGHARKRDGDGRLSLQPGGGEATEDTYRYDPMDEPKLDVDFADLSGAYATDDRSVDPDREDDLEYTSPPLATACDMVGPIEAVFYVATDAKDTDFTATLYRITPDGKHIGIHTGIQRLRYAKDPRRDNPVPPGQVTKIRIDCWAFSQRLEKGERIRLVVSSWGWPGFARNLNTLKPQGTVTKPFVATNRILHDTDHPSHVLLPVVPAKDAPGLSFEQK